MVKRLRQFLIASMMLILPVSAIAQDGPESGGGGGVVYTAAGPRLVDFYNVGGAESYLQNKYAGRSSSQIVAPLRLSFERRDQVTDPAFREVLQVFNSWSEIPFDTIGALIHMAIYKPLIWDFTSGSVSAPASYRPSQLPPEFSINPAAFYLKRERSFHVRLNLPIWNQLPLPDQTGLLIHETLRHVQIGLSRNFDDEALQKATAMLMLCKPGVKLNQYLFFLLNNRRDLAESRFESYETLTRECWK